MNEYKDLVDRIARVLQLPGGFPEPKEGLTLNNVIEDHLLEALRSKRESEVSADPIPRRTFRTLQISDEHRQRVVDILTGESNNNKIHAVKFLMDHYKKPGMHNPIELCKNTTDLIILQEKIPRYYASTAAHIKAMGYVLG